MPGGPLRAQLLAPYIEDSCRAPRSFTLGELFGAQPSGKAVENAGSVLSSNTTISWFQIDNIHEKVPPKSLTGICVFLSQNPSLKVLQILSRKRAPEDGQENILRGGRMLVEAAAKNPNIQRIKLQGHICEFVSELFKRPSNLQELELWGWHCDVAGDWPSKWSIKTLKLKERCYANGKNNRLNEIIDTMAKPGCDLSSSIRHLQLDFWSWALPGLLRSENCVIESLEFEGVNFCHDELTGCSPMDGLLLGLLGCSTITELSFDYCEFDSRAVEKLLKELQAKTLSLRALAFDGNDYDNENEHLLQFWTCNDNLEGLHHDFADCEGLEANMNLVEDRLNRGTLSSVGIPTCDGIAPLKTSLKRALTTGALTRLDLPFGVREQEDADCLISYLEDGSCHLQSLSLGSWEEYAFPIIQALEGEKRLENLRLGMNHQNELRQIVETLGGSLPKIKRLRTLTLYLWGFRDLGFTAKMEDQLVGSLARNWFLEDVSVNVGRPTRSSYGTQYNYNRSGLSFATESTIESLMLRNKALKTILATPPIVSQAEKIRFFDTIESYWGLPDGLSLAFLLMQKVPDCFF